jgi:DNA-directed RNA polymerase III subunit RPC3
VIFLKFRLVTFKPSPTNENIAEYSLKKDNVKLILRYPRYVHLIQTKFGHESAAVVEEMLRAGYQTAAQTIVKSAANSDNKDIKNALQEQREKFANLVKTHYLCRCPSAAKATGAEGVKNLFVPVMAVNEDDLQFFMPEINVKDLISLQEGKPTTASDDGRFFLFFLLFETK